MTEQYFGGDTKRIVWIGSATPTAVSLIIYRALGAGSVSIVHTATMVQSQAGAYYYDYTLPDSRGGYLIEFQATHGGKTYLDRTTFEVIDILD